MMMSIKNDRDVDTTLNGVVDIWYYGVVVDNVVEKKVVVMGWMVRKLIPGRCKGLEEKTLFLEL